MTRRKGVNGVAPELVAAWVSASGRVGQRTIETGKGRRHRDDDKRNPSHGMGQPDREIEKEQSGGGNDQGHDHRGII